MWCTESAFRQKIKHERSFRKCVYNLTATRKEEFKILGVFYDCFPSLLQSMLIELFWRAVSEGADACLPAAPQQALVDTGWIVCCLGSATDGVLWSVVYPCPRRVSGSGKDWETLTTSKRLSDDISQPLTVCGWWLQKEFSIPVVTPVLHTGHWPELLRHAQVQFPEEPVGGLEI